MFLQALAKMISELKNTMEEAMKQQGARSSASSSGTGPPKGWARWRDFRADHPDAARRSESGEQRRKRQKEERWKAHVEKKWPGGEHPRGGGSDSADRGGSGSRGGGDRSRSGGGGGGGGSAVSGWSSWEDRGAWDMG